MGKPRLAVDHDDVISSWNKGFRKGFKEMYGRPLGRRLGAYFSFDLTYGPPELRGVPAGVSWLDVIHRHTIENSMRMMKPVTGAVEVLGRLATIFEIHIVTSRPPQTREITEEWIAKFLPDGLVAGLHMPTGEGLSPLHTDKGEYCRDLGMIGIIDDRDDNVLSVRRAGMLAISFGDYYYNYLKVDDSRVNNTRNTRQVVPEDIHKSYTWREVEGILIPE